jgi:C4-dicarboxylate transporter, DctQ subunit
MRDEMEAAGAPAKFWRGFDLLVRALAALGAVILVAATIIVLVEIVSRYFFRRPILGAIEVTEYCLVWITFLAAPWVQSRGGNVKVEFLLDGLEARKRAAFNFWTCVTAAAGCLLLTFVGIITVWSHYEMGYYLPTPLHPPSAPIISVIPLSTLLLTIQFAREAAQQYRA